MKNLVRMMVLAMAVTAMGGEVSRASVVDYLVTGTGLEAFNFRMDGVKVNNGLAGALHLTEQGKPVSGLPTTYVSDCLDFNGELMINSTYRYDAPVDFAGHTGLAPAWGAANENAPPGAINGADAAAAIQNAAELFYNNFSVNQGNNRSEQAGLQLAIWKVLYDSSAATTGPLNLANGRFQVLSGDAAAISFANSLLAGVNNQGLTGNYGLTGDLFFPDPINPPINRGELAQELFLQSTAVNVTAVPEGEASSLSAGVAALVLLGVHMVKPPSRRPRRPTADMAPQKR